MRARLALELGVTAALTLVFLLFAPRAWMNTGTFIGLALVAFGLILAGRHKTRDEIWGPPESPDFDRIRRCAVGMSVLTIPPVFVFLVIGILARYWLPQLRISENPCSMVSLNFLIALCCYLLDLGDEFGIFCCFVLNPIDIALLLLRLFRQSEFYRTCVAKIGGMSGRVLWKSAG